MFEADRVVGRTGSTKSCYPVILLVEGAHVLGVKLLGQLRSQDAPRRVGAVITFLATLWASNVRYYDIIRNQEQHGCG